MSAFDIADIQFAPTNVRFRARADMRAAHCTSLRNGWLLSGGRGASAGASLATIWLVRDGHRVFSLPGRELTEHYEKREQKEQRKTAADDPDSDLDRKWICNADGVTKNIDQLFHVSSPARLALKVRPV